MAEVKVTGDDSQRTRGHPASDSRSKRWIGIPKWEAHQTRGNPIEAFGRQATPIGYVVQVMWPIGGFIWHRPVAIEVREGDKVDRLPIPDITSRILIAFGLIGMVIGVLTSFLGSGGNRRRKPYDRRTEGSATCHREGR